MNITDEKIVKYNRGIDACGLVGRTKDEDSNSRSLVKDVDIMEIITKLIGLRNTQIITRGYRYQR